MTREAHYKDKSLNYGIAHTRLKRVLGLVGDLTGKKVLDVGCATGYLGVRIKNLGNYVVGIEISKPAAEEARKVLDEVFVCDIEKDCPDLVGFDLAILPEVLEHVFDPAEVLKMVGSMLNENGEIIITTPNILSWTSRIKILFGGFAYTEQGLMDFGHIRFFTYKFLKKVLSESGFKTTRESHIIFPGKLTGILKHWPSLFATQFVVKARKLHV